MGAAKAEPKNRTGVLFPYRPHTCPWLASAVACMRWLLAASPLTFFHALAGSVVRPLACEELQLTSTQRELASAIGNRAAGRRGKPEPRSMLAVRRNTQSNGNKGIFRIGGGANLPLHAPIIHATRFSRPGSSGVGGREKERAP